MTFDASQHPRHTNGQFSSKAGARPEVGIRPLPSVVKTGLSHIGTLNVDNKRDHSYEGQGLSVSQNPEEWQRIARLGGEVHSFERPGNFLDFHALDNAQREEIAQHALHRGWLQRKEIHCVTYYDDEWECEMRQEFDSWDEACDEADALGTDVVTVPGYVYGDMPDSTARQGKPADMGIVAAAWVGEERPDLDGVWWDDEMDVSRLSAPRGVIVPQRIEAWLSAYRRA